MAIFLKARRLSPRISELNRFTAQPLRFVFHASHLLIPEEAALATDLVAQLRYRFSEMAALAANFWTLLISIGWNNQIGLLSEPSNENLAPMP